MADKMMRIAGRDDGGLAKALKVNETGEIITRLNGNNVEDKTSGTISLTKDKNGDSVIRVVDAAPFAYNQATDKLKVETVKNNPLDTRLHYRSGDIAASTTEILADIKSPCELQSLIFSTNKDSCRLYLRPYKADGSVGESLGIIYRDGSGRTPDIRPIILNTEKTTDLWREINFDASSSRYSFRLEKTLKFNNGVKIEVRNHESSNIQKIACETVIAVWE